MSVYLTELTFPYPLFPFSSIDPAILTLSTFQYNGSFQITEVSLMMDWEDSSGSSSDDDTTDYKTMAKDLKDAKDYANSSSTARGSMRGLQKAIQEGWLIQRGRDLCTFAHDRYRQAAQAEALNLPEGSIPKMSLRVSLDIAAFCPKRIL